MTPQEQLNNLQFGEEYKDRVFVFAKDIAPCFPCREETLVFRAKNPGSKPLPFKSVILGSSEREKVFFVKKSFIEFMTGKEGEK